jgi:subtilisin inhibitor-like
MRTIQTTGESTMIHTKLAATAVAVALLSQAAPAAAALPKTELTLAYMADAGYATAVVLKCTPKPGGSHPKAAEACKILKHVGGQPARLIPGRSMCMMVYAPITAEITGRWQGKKMKWSKKYGNTCEMTRATGVLFTF